MLKALRKYNKWILVIGGSLLMVAFLVQPAINQLGGDTGSRLWATLDGTKLRERDARLAGREIEAIKALTFGAYPASLGIDDRDSTRHWVILVHEAREGGFIGEGADGAEWLPELMADVRMQQLASQLTGGRNRDWRALAQNDPGFGQFLMGQHTQALEGFTAEAPEIIGRVAASTQLTPAQVHAALSKVRGVIRMINAYFDAARVSDRRAALTGRELLDAAYVDFLFIPASVGVGAIPDPDEAALGAFFDRFKSVKPGQGEFGIGYLLPRRVKLEWLTLDAKAIENAIAMDPVAVNKRYLQAGKTKYPGDFGAERANVERDIKAERLAEVMQEAHRKIQSEVLRVTARLESDGRYKKLPPDWEASRPKFEAIAQSVVEQVKASSGVTIPLPTVTIRASEWITPDQVGTLDGLGSSAVQTGNLRRGFSDVVFGVRELLADPGAEGEPTLPLQVGVPLVEGYFTGADGSRHYITVLDARKESAPDSAGEIRDQVGADFKRVKAYEQLADRVEEFRSLVAAEGLTKLLDTVAPSVASPDAGRPEVRTRVRVTREQVQEAGAANVNVKSFRDAVMSAAERLDPLTPPDQFDPATTTAAVAIPSRLGVAVARITALAPLTIEQYRLTDAAIVAAEQRKDLTLDGREPLDRPFSLTRLMQRHTFVSGEARDELADEEKPSEPPVSSGG